MAEPLAPKQAVTDLIEEAEPDVSGLLDLLANRVGEQKLYRIAPVASDVPGRSVQHIPAMAPETGAEWSGRWPRPPRLLAHPEPSIPWRCCRIISPCLHLARHAPPRGKWWKRDPELIAVGDYFRIEDDAGERYWVFRAGDGEDPLTGSKHWFFHGIFE